MLCAKALPEGGAGSQGDPRCSGHTSPSISPGLEPQAPPPPPGNTAQPAPPERDRNRDSSQPFFLLLFFHASCGAEFCFFNESVSHRPKKDARRWLRPLEPTPPPAPLHGASIVEVLQGLWNLLYQHHGLEAPEWRSFMASGTFHTSTTASRLQSGGPSGHEAPFCLVQIGPHNDHSTCST
ncbi:unnamed protein product [Arctogadus glacialis]